MKGRGGATKINILALLPDALRLFLERLIYGSGTGQGKIGCKPASSDLIYSGYWLPTRTHTKLEGNKFT